MARKTREESQLTRDRILDAAERVIIQHGVASATVAQIADLAQVSRGAVYGHYKNKVDICVALCLRATQRAVLTEYCTSAPTVLECLHRMGMHILRQWVEPGSMQRAIRILYFLSDSSPENIPLQRFRRSWEAAYRRELLRWLRKAVKNGELPSSLDLTMAEKFIHCNMSGIYHSMVAPKNTIPGHWKGVEHMLYIVLDGLRSSQLLHRKASAHLTGRHD